MGSNIISIGESAFSYCTGLTSIIIPDAVTTIGASAFRGCTGLTSIIIPDAVTSIGDWAFSECTGLTELTSRAIIAPLLGNKAFYGVTTTIPVNIPCGSQMIYNTQWFYFSNFIEEEWFSFSAMSSDCAMGTVAVLMDPTCQQPQAVVNASANADYQFDHWSDGNTNNPRTLTLTSDTSIIGYFTPIVYDTVFIHDTTIIYETNTIIDTLIVTDTVTQIDTFYLTEYIHDTIHDTIYITEQGIDGADALNAKVYSSQGQIVVEGASGNMVTLYDINGRVLATKCDDYSLLRFDVSASGTYMVKIGNHPARKVAVVR
ncbi:MAG: leucine-rich repeat domain-containing protein [Bacteroidales bacterium]|nr:leucine-rich repeat domain-containing protein [Bacteroidales bacterium]